MDIQTLIFCVCAVSAILAAVRVVTAKSPISSAFSLILVLFFVAANYALLHAHFLAALQILVYAGAVMVLFIFVIMLLNADLSKAEISKGMLSPFFAAILAGAFNVLLIKLIKVLPFQQATENFTPDTIKDLGGNVRVISELMFSDYVLPFELTSVLLLVGIVGSVALAKRAHKRTSIDSVKGV